MKRLIITLMCMMLCCAGCARKSPSAIRVVTGITVTGDAGEAMLFRSQEDMSQILNALRTTGQSFPPEENPDALPLPSYHITLTHSDGSQKQWQIKGSCYIRQLPDSWQQTDPKRIATLTQLLRSLSVTSKNSISSGR